MLVPTAETVRLKWFLDTLMENQHPVMLIGGAGSGKSVVVGDKLATLSDKYVVVNIPFNYYTSSEMLQKVLDLKFDFITLLIILYFPTGS